MQLVQQPTSLALIPGHSELEKLIHQSLRGDWIIRVEHMEQDQSPHRRWQQWGKALFAVNSPQPVMDAIYACRASNPAHSIRMYAEKVLPQTRFICPVYTATVNNYEEVQTMQQVSSNPGAKQQWGDAMLAGMRNSNNALWRYVAVIGAVAGSFMLWEGATG